MALDNTRRSGEHSTAKQAGAVLDHNHNPDTGCFDVRTQFAGQGDEYALSSHRRRTFPAASLKTYRNQAPFRVLHIS